MKITEKRMFVIPCEIMYDNPEYKGSNKVQFYLGQAAHNVHPLNFQSDWIIRNRFWNIPVDVMKSIWLLREIGLENNVCFMDLVLYAANYQFEGSTEKSKKVCRKLNLLKYDTRISELDYATELKFLSRLMLPERKCFFLSFLCSLCVENKSADLLAASYRRLANSKKLLERYEDITYTAAITLDCYGQILHPSLYSALVRNYYMDFETYKEYSSKLRKSLLVFAKSRVSQEFKCLDIKKMQKNLLKLL